MTAQNESDPERGLLRYHVGQSLTKSGFEDVLVLSHEAADTVLTSDRREIIETLDSHEVASHHELADLLGREPDSVNDDLQLLVAENVVHYRETSPAKRPELTHETIICEPVVAPDGISTNA